MNLRQWFDTDKVVEIHCHCLPGLDDGPSSWDESLDLCQMMALQGITDVVATPHQLGYYDGQNSPSLVRQRVGELNDRLEAAGILLNVHPGGDVRIDERLPQLLAQDKVLTLGDAGQYLLLELFTEVPLDPQGLLAALLDGGVIPIVSHPERYPWVARQPRLIGRWLELGAGIQITAGSLTGDFGPAVQQAAWRMVRLPGLVLVASDAHDTVRRPPRLLNAAQLIAQQLGPLRAKALCIDGPVRIGQPVGIPGV